MVGITNTKESNSDLEFPLPVSKIILKGKESDSLSFFLIKIPVFLFLIGFELEIYQNSVILERRIFDEANI